MAPGDTSVIAALWLAPHDPAQFFGGKVELREWGGGQLCNSVLEHLPGMHKVLDKDKRRKIYWPFYGDMAWFPLVRKLLCLLIAPLPHNSTKPKKGGF